jgi:hypothetical protein
MASSAEKIAVNVLERKGIDGIWDLHLDAVRLYCSGHKEQAEVLLEIADAAEQIWWRCATAPSA